jgi:hypothetical protein
MALEISIYNRQKQTSASGKEYTSYALAFVPGQRGALAAHSLQWSSCERYITSVRSVPD